MLTMTIKRIDAEKNMVVMEVTQEGGDHQLMEMPVGAGFSTPTMSDYAMAAMQDGAPFTNEMVDYMAAIRAVCRDSIASLPVPNLLVDLDANEIPVPADPG